MSHIVFSHANSFPAGTYRVLFEHLRARGFSVSAVDRFGHDAQYPVTSNWPYLVRQLADFAAREQQRTGQRAYLAGHSLGGFLSVMAAALYPELARGVLLMDSPLIGGWRASMVLLAKQTRLVGSIAPSRISRARRDTWGSAQEALEHFRRKKVFALWDPRVLDDYVTCGLREQEGHRVLAFERAVETSIYNTLPHNLGPLLRTHPLHCPAAFIGGRDSQELRRAGMTMTRRITEGRIALLDGGHLFPMEQPDATAEAMAASLLRLEALGA